MKKSIKSTPSTVLATNSMTATTLTPGLSSGSFQIASGSGFVSYNTPGYYSTKPKPTFEDYHKAIKNSERLQLTLKLFKKGDINLEEAMELISTDIQFAKQEIDRPAQWGTIQSTAPNGYIDITSSNPYTVTSTGSSVVTV